MDLDILIDNCVSFQHHTEIALVIHYILKDKYRYIGNNIWEFYDHIKMIWVKDKNIIKLMNDINNIVCDKFITKSLLWLNKYNNEINDEIKYTYKIRYDNTIDIIVNLKNKKYLTTIIKECKQFFNTADI